MNRLEMAAGIAERVPILAVRDKDDWKQAKQLQARFVKDYPIKKIQNLERDEFVIGKGAGNQSFCYRVERQMDLLGRILGATAFKFGIYYGKTKSDSIEKYRFARHWGNDPDTAFAAVKQAIVDLLQAAVNNDHAGIERNRLSPMF